MRSVHLHDFKKQILNNFQASMRIITRKGPNRQYKHIQGSMLVFPKGDFGSFTSRKSAH